MLSLVIVDIPFIVLSINVEMSSVHLITVTSFYNSFELPLNL